MIPERLKELLRSEKLEKDILVLTLRLMGEDPNTFSPEVEEVMTRWISKAKEVLKGKREI